MSLVCLVWRRCCRAQMPRTLLAIGVCCGRGCWPKLSLAQPDCALGLVIVSSHLAYPSSSSQLKTCCNMNVAANRRVGWWLGGFLGGKGRLHGL